MGRQDAIGRKRHGAGDNAIARAFESGHLDQIDHRLAHPVPRVERAIRVVVEKQRGRKDSRRERVCRIAVERLARVQRRSRPFASKHMQPGHLPPGTRRMRTALRRDFEDAPCPWDVAGSGQPNSLTDHPVTDPFRLRSGFDGRPACTVGLRTGCCRRRLRRHGDNRPVIGLPPHSLECALIEDAKRRTRRIVDDHTSCRPSHDDDVVKARGAVLNQDNNGLAGAQTFLNGRGVPLERLRGPSPRSKRAQQIVTADAPGGRVDEVGKRFRVDVGRTPVAHDHRHSGAATEQFALGKVRHVEEMQRGGGLLSGGGTNRPRRRHDDGGGNQASDKARCQSAMATIKMTSSNTMMIVVVEITTVLAPPARSFCTWRAC